VPDPEKLSQPQFDRFRDFIYRQSGIRMDATKITLVSNRIRRRLRAGDFADFDTYYQHLISPQGAGELEQFLDAITTNETHFFRTPAHFEWFRGDFLSDVILKQRRGERQSHLRVWSAACSTGEEPYSLAICTAENSLRLKDWKISVVGTDISEAVLKEARQAVYRQRSLEEVTPVQLKRYFDTQADGQSWQVRPAVKELVEFRRHNLMEPLRLPPFDCVFIRNVLIYFDRDSKRAVISNLIGALTRGGYLVVGPSEGVYDMLEPLVKKATYLYQKP
jgi:chemotaxis protein methyltransferase CheR